MSSAAVAQRRLESILTKTRKALVLGIGGGGDIVGALASARLCEHYGAEFVLGGIAWERLPIDPHPGPRAATEIVAALPVADGVVFAGPDTRTADGATFAEAHMARYLGAETLLIDLLGGPGAVTVGLATAVERLGVDLVVCIDVGGDVLGNGSEPGLASPLCDAVMLAAAARLERSGVRTLGGVFGPCCDGELTVEELLGRLASVASAGGLVGSWGMTTEVADELERVVEVVPTEASAQAIRCARGEIGGVTIRRGRRRVFLSPLGALTFYFSPEVAVDTVAELARAVADAGSLEDANEVMHALGVGTELDFERSFTEA
jgi:hypothetical protein